MNTLISQPVAGTALIMNGGIHGKSPHITTGTAVIEERNLPLIEIGENRAGRERLPEIVSASADGTRERARGRGRFGPIRDVVGQVANTSTDKVKFSGVSYLPQLPLLFLLPRLLLLLLVLLLVSCRLFLLFLLLLLLLLPLLLLLLFLLLLLLLRPLLFLRQIMFRSLTNSSKTR
jgi:hypothetical protein